MMNKYFGLLQRIKYAKARLQNSRSCAVNAPTEAGREFCRLAAEKERVLVEELEAELLLINNTREQSPESPILQTPCKAKFASEANDLPLSEADGAFG